MADFRKLADAHEEKRKKSAEPDAEQMQYNADGTALVPVEPSITLTISEYTGFNLEALEAVVENNLQTVEEQKREMGLPVHVSTEEMANYPAVIIMAKREEQALLAETGEVTEGFLIVWRPVNEKKYFTTFIGGMVLTRDLRVLKCPFQTRLIKRGRTWQFQ